MPSLRITCSAAAILITLASCDRKEAVPPPGARSAVASRESFVVTPDSIRLYYRVVGTGDETVVAPLALFHRNSLDGLARNRRLVLYDPRGRGRSDTVPANKVSLQRNLSDLDVIRTAVGADRVALIGWSGLGMELFVYALQHPDRVSRLVQLAPVAPRWEPYSSLMMTDRERRTDTTARRNLETRVARGDFRDDPAEHCRALAAIHTPATFAEPGSARLAPDVCVHPTEWPDRIRAYFGAFLGSIEGFDWRDSLGRVAATPRLVIHGERDNTPLEGNREWVANQPNARLLVVAGAGHWPHYERPDVVIPAIDRFLSGEWPEGSMQVR
jgi:pimeloyl-ACP methyl ester carboxylesterase